MRSAMQQLRTTAASALDGAGALARRTAGAVMCRLPLVGHTTQTVRQRLAKGREVEAWMANMPGTVFRLAAVPGGTWRVTFVSPTIVEMTGFSEQQARRPGFRRAHIESPELENLQRQLHAALEFGEASAEFPFIHRDGRRRLFHACLRGAATASGEGEVVMIWTDMTRELEMQSQVGQSAKLATLGTLATSIAHELNQPLATISMAAERVSRELSRLPDLDPQLAQALSRISDQAIRASGIIERMLNFGRINSGSDERVSVRNAIENAEVLTTSKLRSCPIGYGQGCRAG
jgi:signal transduction histidine kinase